MRTRKILAMTYRRGSAALNAEPCEGDCYVDDDVMQIGDGWTTEELRVAFRQLMEVHAGICGNANYRVGIDFAQHWASGDMYIGTLYRFGMLDTVTAPSMTEVIESLHAVAVEYFKSPQYAADVAVDAGRGRSACAHGEDAALLAWMLRAGGRDPGSITIAELQ